jgi:hypothetical protein
MPDPVLPKAEDVSRPSGNGVTRSSETVLYIDASGSMAGFAGCNAGPTQFDIILDRLTTDLSLTTARRFGQASRGGNALIDVVRLDQSVHCPTFYNLIQNPDFLLFRQIGADTVPRTHIYLTDGVLSAEGGQNQGATMEVLRQWVSGGGSLAILAFRSRFAGNAWSEQRQEMIGSASVPNRPFYALVFAPSENGIDRILSALSPAVLTEAVVMRFAAERITCSVAQGPIAVTSQAASPLWFMLPPSVQQRMTNSPEAIAEYRCRIPPQYPVATIVPALEASYRRWSGTAFEPAPSLPSGTSFAADSLAHAPGGSTARITSTFGFDQLTRFGFYTVALQATPGMLRPDVQALSTDDDSRLENFDKTYRFSWLVDQLARAQILGTRSIHPFFLTIQYR